MLVSAGADMSARNAYGQTALSAACQRPHHGSGVVRALLDAGADVNGAHGPAEWTALHWAAELGSADVVKMLIDAGAYVTARDASGQTALVRGCRGGHGDVVRALIDAGADVNGVQSTYGDSPLHVAVRRGHGDVARMLVSAGADVKARDSKGWTPLYAGVYCLCTDSVRALLDAGVEVNGAQGPDGWAPLHQAAFEDSVPLVQILIAAGADMNARTESGDTALSIGLQNRRLSAVQVLIDAGADVNGKQGPDDVTPLAAAVASGNSTAVAMLVSAGADMIARDADGQTALYAACQSRDGLDAAGRRREGERRAGAV